MRTLTFWQDIPSIHVAPLVRAMAEEFEGKVYFIAEKDLPETRANQGWSIPDFGNAKVRIAPGEKERKKHLLKYSAPSAIHIFFGISAYPLNYKTFQHALKLPVQIGVLSEPARHNEGLKTLARRLKYRLQALRFSDKIDFMLLTGQLGVGWYRQAGFSHPILVNWGHFVEFPEIVQQDYVKPRLKDTHTNFLFVGELTPRKGVDLLLRALADTAGILTIIGSGKSEKDLRKLCRSLRLDSRVNWISNIPNQEVFQQMASHDCLVLPSRFDGWGAVINEALSVGTPVIASDACGGSDLLKSGVAGRIFRSGNIGELRQAMTLMALDGRWGIEDRQLLKSWAEVSISPKAAASYLIRVLHQIETIGEVDIAAPWH